MRKAFAASIIVTSGIFMGAALANGDWSAPEGVQLAADDLGGKRPDRQLLPDEMGGKRPDRQILPDDLGGKRPDLLAAAPLNPAHQDLI